MTPIEKRSTSIDNFTTDQLADLVKSNNELDQEEQRWLKEEFEEQQRKEVDKRASNAWLRAIKKMPLEIINRSLFWFFLGSFLFSFVSAYLTNPWWFFWYVVSAFACIFYTPNRKALKELLDAWPNIMDLVMNRRK